MGTAHYQEIKLDMGVGGSSNPFTGTVDLVTRTGKVGTVENLDGGTIGVVSSLGTIDGTIENIGTVHNIGTIGVINDGTIVTTIGDISGGTIDILTSGTLAEVSNVVDGTIAEITSVTEVVNLAGGTVDVLADGTVAVTFDADVPGGTVDLVTRTGNLGTVENLDGGTVDVLADGTVSEVGTVTGVGVLAGGTVQIDTNPVQLTETWGTLVDAAGAEFGTLLESSGAGTYHYIEGMSIVCHSGTVDCYLGYGSAITGTGVIARGIFSEGGGGIARDFKNALYGGGTNTEVIYKIGGAGTVMYTINYRTGT